MDEWKVAWDNIQKEFDEGVITRKQFYKERNYMWKMRPQLIAEQKRQSDG